MWLRGPLSVLDSTSVGSLSCQLSAFGKLTTTDFERKCRGLQEFDRWKATEFRFFSHYAGPLTLKKHTSQPFTNTSFFSMLALPFLYRRQWWAWQTMQSSYSFFFVRECSVIYRKTSLVYNVYFLIHLANYCRLLGPLDSFSCFPFENYLRRLKILVRPGNKPLQQLPRRMSGERARAVSDTAASVGGGEEILCVSSILSHEWAYCG